MTRTKSMNARLEYRPGWVKLLLVRKRQFTCPFLEQPAACICLSVTSPKSISIHHEARTHNRYSVTPSERADTKSGVLLQFRSSSDLVAPGKFCYGALSPVASTSAERVAYFIVPHVEVGRTLLALSTMAEVACIRLEKVEISEIHACAARKAVLDSILQPCPKTLFMAPTFWQPRPMLTLAYFFRSSRAKQTLWI